MSSSVVRFLSAAILFSSMPSVFAQDARVLNLDFGNGGQYVGDGGVLSSPGGTFWNEVRLDESRVAGVDDFLVPPVELLDEFGQSFGIGTPPFAGLPLPNLISGFGGFSATPVSSPSSSGPLNDGIRIDDFFSVLGIRELGAPFDIAIYFNEPSSIILNNSFAPLSGDAQGTTGQFPGFEGFDFLLFEDVDPVPTTIGFPLLPGVFVGLPDEIGATASIAAIQIRGESIFTPEPSTATMVCLGLLPLFRRCRT